MTKIDTEPENSDNRQIEYEPQSRAPVIKAAPRVRQIYWCEFQKDCWQPEFGKLRPVLVISYKHVLNGHCLVLPITSAEQLGPSSEWAHKLRFQLNAEKNSIVVCNHLYTVSNSRLRQFGSKIPRMPEDEFQEILQRVRKWLPKLSE